MMSYGSTAETSFTLVRTLVAQDPALLERVDAVLRARGFAKLTASDAPPSQHPRARAEAVRELKWLAEYLQNVYNRADKFTPHDKPSRRVVMDDDDDDDDDDEENERETEAQRNGSALNGVASTAGGAGMQPAEYDHTSEESSERSSSERSSVEPEVPKQPEHRPASAAHAVTEHTQAPPPALPRMLPPAQPQAHPPVPAQTEHASARSAPEEPRERRLLARQQHVQEREQARRMQQQRRLEREQQKAWDEEQRMLKNREKLLEKRERAARARLDAEKPADVEIWCLCRKPAYGFMLACVNPKCPYEWFHGDCVGLTAAPKARWFCPVCRPRYGVSAVPVPKAAAPRHAAPRHAAPKHAAPKPAAPKAAAPRPTGLKHAVVKTAAARPEARRSHQAQPRASGGRFASTAEADQPAPRKRNLRSSTVAPTTTPAVSSVPPRALRERRRRA